MDQGSGSLEEDFPVKSPRWWGLRPWKRHSTILMVVGVLYALIGFLYMNAPPSRGREVALAAILQVAPMEFWGSLFIATGFMAIVSSRWPPLTATWGYMVLTGMSSGWSAAYLLSSIFYHAPWSTNSTQIFLWGILAFLWWAISGLLNPDTTAVTEHGKF